MGGVEEPVPRALHRRLRAGILSFKASEPRRRFPAVVHVGDPVGHHHDFADTTDLTLDHGLRTEIVTALLDGLEGGEPPLVWLTRPGDLAPHDADQLWLAAALAAYGEQGVPLTMVVVTRSGWYDPRSGTRREWVRLRPRS